MKCFFIIILLLLVTAILSCTHKAEQIIILNPPAPPDTLSLAGCDTSSVTFSKSIQPVLQRSCVGCHSGSPPGGGIDLTSYSGVLAVVNTGRLLGAIQWLPGYFHMPKNGNKLSVCEISLFRIWVDAGALNN